MCNPGIHYFSIRDIPSLSHSPDLGQNPDAGISDFRISGQCHINKNCHNSRASNDIDMKLGPATKLAKKNTASQKNDDDIMSANCGTIIIIPIYGQFQAIRKPDSGHIFCKTYIFTVAFYPSKPENRT